MTLVNLMAVKNLKGKILKTSDDISLILVLKPPSIHYCVIPTVSYYAGVDSIHKNVRAKDRWQVVFKTFDDKIPDVQEMEKIMSLLLFLARTADFVAFKTNQVICITSEEIKKLNWRKPSRHAHKKESRYKYEVYVHALSGLGRQYPEDQPVKSKCFPNHRFMVTGKPERHDYLCALYEEKYNWEQLIKDTSERCLCLS